VREPDQRELDREPGVREHPDDAERERPALEVRHVVRDGAHPVPGEVAERAQIGREPEEEERDPRVALVEVERDRGQGDRGALESKCEANAHETSTFT
jgi:hypothetical protein